MSRRGSVGRYGCDARTGYGGSTPLHPERDARLDGLLAEASTLLRTLSGQLDRLRDERRGPGDMRDGAVYRERGRSETRPL